MAITIEDLQHMLAEAYNRRVFSVTTIKDFTRSERIEMQDFGIKFRDSDLPYVVLIPYAEY